MKTNLDIVDKLYTTLMALQPLKLEDKSRLDKKFRLEFNYNSNHIEGNTLTYGETELLLIFDDTLGKHNMREYEETKAHDVAYHMIEEWAKSDDRPLTEQAIKELNEIILVRPYWKDAITQDGQNTRRQIKVGNYKEYPNSVRLQNGEIFEYASPTETPILMQELIEWYRSEQSAVHPITLATMLHYKFVRIHPFDDGNGRISRLLMNYVLLKNNYPPVIIKSADKDNYLRALHIADIGDYEPLISYVAEQSIWSLKISIKAVEGLDINEPEDWEKELSVFKREIGRDKVSKIELKYSKETVNDVFTSVVQPLINLWENHLEKFDILFFYRRCNVSKKTRHHFYHQENNSADLVASIDSLWTFDPVDNALIKSLEITCEYEGLINPQNNKKYPAGDLRFDFHDNAFEISNKAESLRKVMLYHESLTTEEINNILNTFFSRLINDVKNSSE